MKRDSGLGILTEQLTWFPTVGLSSSGGGVCGRELYLVKRPTYSRIVGAPFGNFSASLLSVITSRTGCQTPWIAGLTLSYLPVSFCGGEAEAVGLGS